MIMHPKGTGSGKGMKKGFARQAPESSEEREGGSKVFCCCFSFLKPLSGLAAKRW